jgi:hypothetical protein
MLSVEGHMRRHDLQSPAARSTRWCRVEGLAPFGWARLGSRWLSECASGPDE